MEAVYLSGVGGDNYALGALMHASPVNRKESPHALDERQLIMLDATPLLEIHNITVASKTPGRALNGSFRLSLGGKQTRAISVNASAAAVTAAVRELLSNCGGGIGDEADPSGNTFDCWHGVSTEYRGLASRTVSGKTCIDWRLTPIWHPSLAVIAGLDKNLCRNPTLEFDLGLWCYTAPMVKEACAVPQCGAGGIVATFEDEEATGLAWTRSWDYTFGVEPRVSTDGAFCGRNALYQPGPFSTSRRWWMEGKTGRDDMKPYRTAEYPFICMAYKIPPATRVMMLVLISYINGAARPTEWRGISMTETSFPSYAKKTGQFDIRADGNWYHTCINFHSNLDTLQAYQVERFRFWNDEPGARGSSYDANPFWIDEFSVSKTRRSVFQTEYPQVANALPRLVSVTRTPVPDGFTWTLALTSENCSVPAVNFQVSTAEVNGNLAAMSQRVSEHSLPIEGSVSVSFGGEDTSFGVYAEAAEVKSRLDALSTIRGTSVYRLGTCHTGYSWLVTFTHVPGDVPELQVSSRAFYGDHVNATVVVETVNDGGLMMGPLSADYFHVPVDQTNLQLWVNDGAAMCKLQGATESVCRFDFAEELTPSVHSVELLVPDSDPHSVYRIQGSRLLSRDQNATSTVEVMVGKWPCMVSSFSDDAITCRLQSPTTAGRHTLQVNVPGKGFAKGNLSVNLPLLIHAVSPSSFSVTWPTVLRITGFGFDESNISAHRIKITGPNSPVVECTPLNATVTEIFCMTSPTTEFEFSTAKSLPSSDLNRRRDDGGSILSDGLDSSTNISVQLGNAVESSANGLLSQLFVDVPQIKRVQPSSGSGGGGTLVTIFGLGLAHLEKHSFVKIGPTDCPVVFKNQSTVICRSLPSISGVYNVSLGIDGIGISLPSLDSTFEYLFDIQKIYPDVSGIGGGVLLAITGNGFTASDGKISNVLISRASWSIYVIGLYIARKAVEVQEIAIKFQSGQSDAGYFRLKMLTSPLSVLVSLNSTENRFAALLSEFRIPGGVNVEKIMIANGFAFRLTFNSLQQQQPVFLVDTSGLTGAIVTVVIVRPGALMPNGSWRVGLGGVPTVWLPLNASAEQLRSAMTDQIPRWKGVKSIEVISADGFPGAFLNRFYPRQWVVRIQSASAAGPTMNRCTNPEYIDWDPSACPAIAAKLYLSYFPLYWPTRIPKPGNLGDLQYTAALQRACNNEANFQGLIPSTCEGLLLAETLPICRERENLSPPCWTARWSEALIRHRDGTDVIYARDDSFAPSDTKLGFRFWRRRDWDKEQQKLTPSVQTLISTLDTGVHIHPRDVSGTETRECEIVLANETTLIARVPNLELDGRTYGKILASDVFYKPFLMWRPRLKDSGEQVILEEAVSAVIGLMGSGYAGFFSGKNLSSVTIKANSAPIKFSDLSLDFWVRISETPGTTEDIHIVRLVGNDTCLLSVMCSESRWKLLVRDDSPDDTQQIVYGSHITVGEWTHIAVTVDYWHLKFYIGGELANETMLRGTDDTLYLDKFVLGSGCESGLVQCTDIRHRCFNSSVCASGFQNRDITSEFSNSKLKPFEGLLDWFQLYPLALSGAIIEQHASFVNAMHEYSVEARHGHIPSVCSGVCRMQVLSAHTPVINFADPAIGIPGNTLSLFGKFRPKFLMTVRVGPILCPILQASEFYVSCVLSPSQRMGRYQIFVDDSDAGLSIGNFEYSVSSAVQSVEPNIGISALGGALISVRGKGFDTSEHNITVAIGDFECLPQVVLQDLIVCEMSSREAFVESTANLSVTLWFGSVQAFSRCNTSKTSTGSTQDDGLCRIQVSAAATPKILSVSTRMVMAGTILALSGHGFPFKEGTPAVRIGSAPCDVTESNATHIVCIVGLGESGQKDLIVSYRLGNALDVTRACSPSFIYSASIDNISPWAGSAFGGQNITLTGSGFSPDIAKNRVTVGPLLCQVIFANFSHLVFTIPYIADGIHNALPRLELFTPKTGTCVSNTAEKSLPFPRPGWNTQCPLLKNLTHAWNSSQSDFSFIAFPVSSGAAPPNVLGEYSKLFDANPNTIWRSAGNRSTWIGLDLGRVSRITSLVLKWLGNFSASDYRVIASLDCENSTFVQNRSMCRPWGNSTRNMARSCGVNENQPCLTMQSSTSSVSTSSRAVDSDRSTLFTSGSCTLTNEQTFPWWRIDFNQTRSIRGGKIWNRNFNSALLDAFQIFVGNGTTWDNVSNALCFRSVKLPTSLYEEPYSLEFDCVGTGRYIFVMLPRTGILSFCEIEFYESMGNSCSTAGFNQTDIIPLNVDARYLVIQLLRSLDNKPDFRISDIAVLGARTSGNGSRSAHTLDLQIGSQSATCQDQNQSSCLFIATQYPEVFFIQPASGTAGDRINASGKGFNASNCYQNTVTVGFAPCLVISCTDSWIECILQHHPAGSYSVSVYVFNSGRARVSLPFWYGLQVQNLSYSDGGFGSGLSIAAIGNGFDIRAGTELRMCGVECTLGLMNATHINFLPLPLLDSTIMPRNFYLDIVVSDDALEYAYPWCEKYTVWGTSLFCYCFAEDWQCYRERYADVKLLQNSISAVLGQWQLHGRPIQNRVFPCDCRGKQGVIIPDADQLGFDLIQGYFEEWSPQAVYFRFESLDVAYNSTIVSATLIVTPSTTTCRAGSTIRIWAESDVSNKPINPSSRGSLRRRNKTAAFVDWRLTDDWKWAYRQEESADLSTIVREVVQTPGWRSGNPFMLILQQNMKAGGGPCRILSSEAGAAYAPKLRLSIVDTSSNIERPEKNRVCDVEVSIRVPAHVESNVLAETCRLPLRTAVSKVHPTPSISGVSIDPSLVSLNEPCCASGGRAAYLALDSDLDTAWVSQSADPVNFTIDLGFQGAFVNFGSIAWTRDYALKYSILVSLDGVSWETSYIEQNSAGEVDEFVLSRPKVSKYVRIWMQSAATKAQTSFSIRELTLFGCGQRCSDCDKVAHYQTLGRICRGNGWENSVNMGFQTIDDCEYMCTQDDTCTAYQYSNIQNNGKYLCTRFRMTDVIGLNSISGVLNDGFCNKKIGSRAMNYSLISTLSSSFQAKMELTPKLAMIFPSTGSTAGGTKVTVIGNFMTDRLDFISIDLGGIDCRVLTWVATSVGNSRGVACEAGYSGVTNGGLKYARATVVGVGSSVVSNSFVFWYIDAWSSPSTWGGNSPPTGCGSYKDDLECSDSVVIPQGQVILLDVSPPRFYLILIEGKLVFQRRDLHLQVHSLHEFWQV